MPLNNCTVDELGMGKKFVGVNRQQEFAKSGECQDGNNIILKYWMREPETGQFIHQSLGTSSVLKVILFNHIRRCSLLISVALSLSFCKTHGILSLNTCVASRYDIIFSMQEKLYVSQIALWSQKEDEICLFIFILF